MNDKRHNMTDAVVFTDRAQCRDCYRCLRVCPVKAIRMCDDQASVVPEYCIGCGNCFRECPQNAKLYRKEVTYARELIKSGRQVIVSVAPSFAAVFEQWQIGRLPSALRRLGFARVAETAVAAWEVSQQMAKVVQADPQGIHIASACPAAVTYLENYHPESVKYLMPIASPMIVHGRMIKKAYPDAAVVFIGPCVAKKLEAARPEHAGVIDAVLTFEELFDWLADENITLGDFEESGFDDPARGDASLYPLVGGSLKSAGIDTDMLAADVLSVSGQEEMDEALHCVVQGDRNGVLIEPLFCRHGCINGPLADWGESDSYQRRRRVLDYVRAKTDIVAADKPDIVLDTKFNSETPQQEFTDEQIDEVLRQIGKVRPEDRLNCGACGYATCCDKAAAVLKGMASIEMCIPYMRRLAEQRTDLIIDTSPNGIIILDETLSVISMNQAFKKMFVCGDNLFGKNIAKLMDPDMFERARRNPEHELIERIVKFPAYNLIINQIVYRLSGADQYVGIFINMTNVMQNRKQLDVLRQQTVRKAQELIDNQVSMAQEIVEFLGKSTARSEEVLENLLNMAQADGEQQDAENEPDGPIKRVRKWNRHIYTPK